MRAEQPHTEFTTTSVVPFASLSCSSTSSGVRISIDAEAGEILAHRRDETLVVHLLGKSHKSLSLRL